jgi:hypothetical protein
MLIAKTTPFPDPHMRRLTLITLILFALPALPASAWNSPGHIIVALIAYDELDPDTRTQALDLIRSHPRFRQHFENSMPRELASGDALDRDQWLFAHAATWPDQVRDAKRGVDHQDVTQFNRPYWHFINEPVFLNENERRLLMPEISVNRRRDPPDDPDDANMNVIQALKNSTKIVADKTALAEKRSIHLCWLMHLAGDSHQPLHSAALFTTHRFRSGDRGGNYLQFAHGWNLHAFWDEQVSNDEPFETLRILATDLGQNKKLQAAGQSAATKLDPGQWLDESFAIANQYAYTPEVLEKIAAREGHSHLGPLDLAPKYKTDAEEVVERRAVEAGHRLAATIKQSLQ